MNANSAIFTYQNPIESLGDVCMCIYTYMNVCMYVCIHIYMDIRADKLVKKMSVHIYIDIIYTYTHTHKNPVAQLLGQINADSVVMVG